VELLPNSMSFRVISTLDVNDESEIPADYSGRVRRSFNGSESYVAWFTNGHLDNPGRNHPAYRRFRADGQVKYEMFYEAGKLHDPSDRDAAVRGYFANGKMHYGVDVALRRHAAPSASLSQRQTSDRPPLTITPAAMVMVRRGGRRRR
jgi:hypothetical protein